MSEPRIRTYTAQGSNPPAEIPADHLAALDRRHALDAQQKASSSGPTGIPAPHVPRGRPPG